MAGSDIQANTVTTQGSNVSAFGGPTRLKGFIIIWTNISLYMK